MTEPTVQRPSLASGYGISASPDGMLTWAEVDQALQTARNYWVATTRPEGGPHVTPVWGVWIDAGLYFGTDPASQKSANLDADDRVIVHLESGDDVVIVEGRAELLPPDEILRRVRRPYEAKYDLDVVGDEPGGGWFRVQPVSVLAWREASFPATATRFSFSKASSA